MIRFGRLEDMRYRGTELDAWQKTRQEMVDLLIATLNSPALSMIKFWTPARVTMFDWAVYEVGRDGDEVRTHMRLERPVENTLGCVLPFEMLLRSVH